MRKGPVEFLIIIHFNQAIVIDLPGFFFFGGGGGGHPCTECLLCHCVHSVIFCCVTVSVCFFVVVFLCVCCVLALFLQVNCLNHAQ